jgi:hypothetical protein
VYNVKILSLVARGTGTQCVNRNKNAFTSDVLLKGNSQIYVTLAL